MVALPVHDVPADPIQPWWRLRAGWVYASILAGELDDHDGADLPTHRVDLEVVGTLTVPGGRLVAADPYVMGEPEPFTRLLGVEEAEVVVARATVGEDHDRVAALLLQVGSEPVRDWVMATVGGQDVATLERDDFFGFGVDAGTCALGGVDAMQVAGRVLAEDEGMLEDPISSALFSDGMGTRSAVLVAPAPGARPVAVCSSGWGDGCYPTWMGLDATGAVVVVVTDFLLTGDPYATSVVPETPVVSQEAPAVGPAERGWRSTVGRWFGR